MDPKLTDLIKRIGQKYLKADKETKVLIGMRMIGRMK